MTADRWGVILKFDFMDGIEPVGISLTQLFVETGPAERPCVMNAAPVWVAAPKDVAFNHVLIRGRYVDRFINAIVPLSAHFTLSAGEWAEFPAGSISFFMALPERR